MQTQLSILEVFVLDGERAIPVSANLLRPKSERTVERVHALIHAENARFLALVFRAGQTMRVEVEPSAALSIITALLNLRQQSYDSVLAGQGVLRLRGSALSEPVAPDQVRAQVAEHVRALGHIPDAQVVLTKFYLSSAQTNWLVYQLRYDGNDGNDGNDDDTDNGAPAAPSAKPTRKAKPKAKPKAQPEPQPEPAPEPQEDDPFA